MVADFISINEKDHNGTAKINRVSIPAYAKLDNVLLIRYVIDKSAYRQLNCQMS
jgi:hypothetical protein